MVMHKDDAIFIAGHRGLVGSALMRRLQAEGYRRLLYRNHTQLDLTDALATDLFFETQRPTYVFLAAAKVGGIEANRRRPADFLRINLQIQTNVLDAAYRHGVEKLLFLGSSCIYPKFAPQPIREEALLTGALEPTNDAYAIAKIAGLMMCRAYNQQFGTRFIAAMPTNLYGPNDNFDLQTSHVLPALIRRMDEARLQGNERIELWGSGRPRREFLHVDDLADALLFLMQHFDATDEVAFVNVGVGEDLSIAELAEQIARIVGYSGEIAWNTTMPDGTPQKRLDVSRLHALGWRAHFSLEEGIRQTFAWYREHRSDLLGRDHRSAQ